MAKRKHDGPTLAGRIPLEVPPQLADRIRRLVAQVVNEIPRSREPQAAEPAARARELIARAARETAVLSGALALPGGPLAAATLLADLFGVWRRQAKLVADIAAAYGRSERLTREVLLRCLFGGTAADAVGDLLVRGGQRMLMRRALMVSRWLPVVGAVTVAAYAYYDTERVGRDADALFRQRSGFSG